MARPDEELWVGLDDEPPTDLTNEVLFEELRRTRRALRALRDSQRRTKAYTWAWRAVALGLVVVAFLGWQESERADERFEARDAQLRDFQRNLYIGNCEASNAGRQTLREDNIRDAETLINLSQQSDNPPSPERVEQYREAVRRNNEDWAPRDCQAEYEASIDEAR